MGVRFDLIRVKNKKKKTPNPLRAAQRSSRETSGRGSTRPTRAWHWLVLAGLLLVFFLAAEQSMQRLSASTDEVVHLPAGLTYLKAGDFRLNPEHPPLTKILAALWVLPLRPKLNFESPHWKQAQEVPFGFETLYSNDADRLLFWGRFPFVLLAVLLGVYVFLWARDLFGPVAGLGAALFYSFCPNLIAHARFVTSDLALACFFTMTLYHFWKFTETATTRSFLFWAVSLGLALASKFSSIILLFLLPFLSLLFSLRPFRARAPEDSVTSWGSSERLKVTRLKGMFGGRVSPRSAWILLLGLLIAGVIVQSTYFFPPDLMVYWKGVSQVNANHVQWTHMYLNGVLHPGRSWYYFLEVFLLKAPLPFLIAIVFAVIAFIRRSRRSFRDEGILLLPIFGFFVFISVFADPMGVRYILPVIPLLLIWASRIFVVAQNNRALRVLLVFICLWQIGTSVRAYPDYLSYFNEAVGMSRGYRYVDDSNVDWGQDMKRAAGWLNNKGFENVNIISFSGVDNPAYYGVHGKFLSVMSATACFCPLRRRPGFT